MRRCSAIQVSARKCWTACCRALRENSARCGITFFTAAAHSGAGGVIMRSHTSGTGISAPQFAGTISGNPPLAEPTTGNPQASDSMTTVGQGSRYFGMQDDVMTAIQRDGLLLGECRQESDFILQPKRLDLGAHLIGRTWPFHFARYGQGRLDAILS